MRDVKHRSRQVIYYSQTAITCTLSVTITTGSTRRLKHFKTIKSLYPIWVQYNMKGMCVCVCVKP